MKKPQTQTRLFVLKLFFLLFLLLPVVSIAQLDETLLKQIKTAKNCDELAILTDSVDQLFKRGDETANAAISLLLQHKECPRALAYGYKLHCNKYMMQYIIDSAQYYMNLSHYYALQASDTSLVYFTEMMQGQLYALESRADSALEVLKRPKQYYKDRKPHLYKFILQLEQTCYHVMGQYENLKKNCYECIQVGKKEKDDSFIGQGYYYLATVAQENKQFEEAKALNDTAENYAIKSSNLIVLRGIYALDQTLYSQENLQDSVLSTLRKLDAVIAQLDDNQKMWHKTNWINYYRGQNAFDKVIQLADSIISFGENNYLNPVIENYALSQKGKALLEQKKYAQSLPILQKALSYYYTNNIVEEFISNLPNLIVAFSYNNLPDSVKHYTMIYESMNDSIYSAQNRAALTEMSVKYETQQKEEQIADQKNELNAKAAREKQQKIIIWISLIGLVVAGVLASLLFNANRQKQANLQLALAQKDQITKQSEERELLLKEIHHRVKNNLQIISNLLELQATKSDSDTSAALMEGQLRVQSMAMIHQKLYQQDNVAVLDFNEYLQSMVTNWKNSFETKNPAEVNIICNNIALDVDTSIPLGLIINELITNAYKHAFADIEKPMISIALQQVDKGTYELKVQDNGQGIDIDIKQLKSLGMRLVNRLVKQLDGELKIENHHGACFNILFKDALLRGQVE